MNNALYQSIITKVLAYAGQNEPVQFARPIRIAPELSVEAVKVEDGKVKFLSLDEEGEPRWTRLAHYTPYFDAILTNLYRLTNTLSKPLNATV